MHDLATCVRSSGVHSQLGWKSKGVDIVHHTIRPMEIFILKNESSHILGNLKIDAEIEFLVRTIQL